MISYKEFRKALAENGETDEAALSKLAGPTTNRDNGS